MTCRRRTPSHALISALLAVAACDNTIENPNVDVTNPGAVKCDVDSSGSPASAFAGTLGTALTDTLCPRADKDYWRLAAGGARQLIALTADYNKLSSVQLAAELLGPVGLCMANALTACSGPGTCGAGELCDAARGGCRAIDAPPCTNAADCGGGQSCYNAEASLGEIRETVVSGNIHHLTGHFPAFVAGDYVALLYDHTEQESDAQFKYALTLEQVQDPDVQEPNNAKARAATVTSGTTVTGYLSYVNDEDWYRVVPTGSTPAVVKIDLTWPAGGITKPTWVVSQGTWQFSSATEKLEGGGAGAIRTRRAALVTPGSSDVYVRVTNSGENSITEAYSLRIEVIADPDEGATRNDSSETAAVVNLGATGSAGYAATHKLIAQNDVDWYQLSRASIAQNSLAYVTLDAPITAGYVLQAQFYVPTSTTCSATQPCTQGRPCSPAGQCLELWVQRPSPDGPGDPQDGGLSPNHLEAQLPILGSGTGNLFLRVSHNTSTVLPAIGFDFTTGYAMNAQNKAEPDPGDLNVPDNDFIGRPQDKDFGDFSPVPRLISGQTTSTPRTSSGGFAVVAPGASATATQCATITLRAFDGFGAAITTDVTLTAAPTLSGGATLYSDTTCTTALASNLITGGSAPYGLLAPSAGMVTVTLAYDGNTVDSLVPVAAAGGIQVISFVNDAAAPGDPPRAVTVGGTSRPIRVRLPSAPTQPKLLNLSMSSGGTSRIVCVPGFSGCPGSGLTLPGFTDPCPEDVSAADASCQVAVPAGQTYYDVAVSTSSGASLILLTVQDPASTGPFPNARLVLSPFTPGAISMPTYAMTGYLSYDGDQDFFRVPLPNVGAGGLTVFLTMPASNVDLRASMWRNGDAGRGASIGAFSGRPSDEYDQCIANSCDGPGSCDNTRKTCNQPAVTNKSVGPAATSPVCVYITRSSGDLIVWVNDIDTNDGDETAEYELRFDYAEGCPAVCGVCP